MSAFVVSCLMFLLQQHHLKSPILIRHPAPPGSDAGGYAWHPSSHVRLPSAICRLELISRYQHPEKVIEAQTLLALCDKTGQNPCVAVIAHGDYMKLNARQINEILRNNHIVVSACPGVTRKFNKRSLRRLGGLKDTTVIHGMFMIAIFFLSKITMTFLDQSVKDSNVNAHIRHRRGTLQDILTASSAKSPKALNGLDFPGAGEGVLPLPFATDVVAFAQTRGKPFCLEEYPTLVQRWGLCATSGAHHHEHEDCEGSGTWVVVDSGIKIWIVAVPLPGHTWADFGDTELFVNLKGEISKMDRGKFQWVALVLGAGDTL